MKSWGLFGLFILITNLFSSVLWSKGATDTCMVYAYMDETGRIIKTTDKRSIPRRFLTSMISTRDCAQAHSIRSSGGALVKMAPTMDRSAPPPQSEDPTTNPPVDTSSIGQDEDGKKTIYGWFAYTESWKVALALLFAAAILAGTIGVVATAFHWSTLWGLACLFPPAIFVYLVFHWKKAWPSAVVWLAGMAGGSFMVFFVLSLV